MILHHAHWRKSNGIAVLDFPPMTEKVVVLDRGNVEFLYPGDWTLGRGPHGSLTLGDPTESCRIDVSYTKLTPEAASVPIEELLRALLSHAPEAGDQPEIETLSDVTRRLAWADYAYVTPDKRSGSARDAHGRWLVGTNGLFQLLMTFYYWSEDASWAVPAWKRIVDTIEFGDGHQLSGPEEHWSMRPRN